MGLLTGRRCASVCTSRPAREPTRGVVSPVLHPLDGKLGSPHLQGETGRAGEGDQGQVRDHTRGPSVPCRRLFLIVHESPVRSRRITQRTDRSRVVRFPRSPGHASVFWRPPCCRASPGSGSPGQSRAHRARQVVSAHAVGGANGSHKSPVLGVEPTNNWCATSRCWKYRPSPNPELRVIPDCAATIVENRLQSPRPT
jgi:hypothetical protein